MQIHKEKWIFQRRMEGISKSAKEVDGAMEKQVFEMTISLSDTTPNHYNIFCHFLLDILYNPENQV